MHYRIYGDNKGYELIDIVKTEEEIEPYLNNKEYDKILVIEHKDNSDFPYILTCPQKNEVKVKVKKK